MTRPSARAPRRHCACLLIALAGLLTACADDDPGEGQVAVRAYGEAFIEEGIPASQMEDGWAVSFERFSVTIAEVGLAGATLAGPFTVDLAQASAEQGQPLGTLEVEAGDRSDAAYVIERMEVVGSATREGEARTFDWVFDAPIHHTDCEAVTRVTAAETSTLQITVHADHLFYDSLVSEAPALRFQALADADADGDGALGVEELAAASVGAYDTGNEDITDLWAWLQAQARTVGHMDGEFHCEVHDHDH